MQRKIAQELRLGPEIMAMFDEQDEEDDFIGVILGSRGPIRSAAAVIDQTLRESRFIMIFLNGSYDVIPLTGTLGIPEYNDSIIIWTYSKRSVSYRSRTPELYTHTDVCLASYHDAMQLSSSEFMALLREEAGSIVDRYHPCVLDMDATTVLDCCLYEILLRCHTYYVSATSSVLAHAPNYWVCDGIIQRDRALETSYALHPIIIENREYYYELVPVFNKLKKDVKAPFLLVEDDDAVYEKRPYRWIVLRLKNNKALEDMQAILPGASSIFLTFEITAANKTHLKEREIINSLFKCCSNLRVLALYGCAFSFVSPPFHHCHTLRFLGLYHCTDDNNNNNSAAELEGGPGWACLQNLWVMDLNYTECVEMLLLSEDKMELMANLIELNIEGVRWSQSLANRLQRRLPHLRRLRIINPKYDEEAETSSSSDDIIISDSFLMDKTSLEILDLSGNRRGMRNLPASISKASRLQVLIVNDCDGLENVVVPNGLPASLRSFSFYGSGSARASMISLQGCTRLDNLLISSLPHLVELDLSGCAIKVLDFKTMVVGIPMLKQLFLLGCEHLRKIEWYYYYFEAPQLQLLCIDTRPGAGTRRVPAGSLGAPKKSSDLQVHAVTVDARMVRSLCDLLSYRDIDRSVYFNINIAASSTAAACGGVVVQQGPPESAANRKEMAAYSGDVFTQAGCDRTPMRAFPQPPTRQLDRHIEIGYGSHSVQSEVEMNRQAPRYEKKLSWLMMKYTQSLHVHDVSTYSNTMPATCWGSLRWCRVERCSSLHAVFPPGTSEENKLEIIWVSDLLMARCIWSKASIPEWDMLYRCNYLQSLRHLHLRSCPSIQFAVPVRLPSFLSLETLHVIYCGQLRHVFEVDQGYNGDVVRFPKLTTVHLHDLPALRQICEVGMIAPALKTIKTRGCWSLRRLPALKGRMPGERRPAVEDMEKDVWDALEWDGVDAGHHPSLFNAPVCSRYSKKKRLLRGTVLR
ncbi:unnamed protein product [Urochloa decumbens]|uniref:Disease resistance protein At4g27190-like leucine-rich repeats domain-containing protein n=1 Tax=Urochloa decumbens TaxID=240449 RepID=A0ABC9BX21_9POAL